MLLLMLTGLLPGVEVSSAASQNTTETMEMRFGENTFRVPLDYLSPRPAPSAPGSRVGPNFMRLAFWMPDGLSVARDVANSLDLRQHGRVVPGSEPRFIVVVADVRAINDVNAPPAPESQLGNVLALGSELFNYDSAFGAMHIVPRKIGQDVRQYYYGSADFYINYFIHCDKDLASKPVQLCDGDIRFKSLGLTGHLIFPADEISKIRNIANTSEQLLMSWRVN